jgi:hypothetical protein
VSLHEAEHHVRCTVLRVACIGVLAVLGVFAAPVLAEHEIDHRFVIEGVVCKPDGQPAADMEVVARDARISLGRTHYTDSHGRYRIQLHLHNDNAGDPIVVSAGSDEKKIRADFDPKDMKTERKVIVNFGSGCATPEQGGAWVYYGAGVGAAVAAAFVGARWLNRKSQRGAKGKKLRN